MEHWSVAKYIPSITPPLQYSKNTWDLGNHIKMRPLLGYRSVIISLGITRVVLLPAVGYSVS